MQVPINAFSLHFPWEEVSAGFSIVTSVSEASLRADAGSYSGLGGYPTASLGGYGGNGGYTRRSGLSCYLNRKFFFVCNLDS